jgi:hypothetical protein
MRPAPDNTADRLPDGLRIGERFLLSFDDPTLARSPYHGRLQDLSPDGCLCIDAPYGLRPPRGTPVTLRSLGRDTDERSFSAEVLGSGRLDGRLPVLLVKPPPHLERNQRRGAHRVAVCLRAQAEWKEWSGRPTLVRKPCVIADLSGGGAQVYLRRLPRTENLRLFLTIPDTFVEEWARLQLARQRSAQRNPFAAAPALAEARRKIHAGFNGIYARVVGSRVQHSRASDEPVYAVSVAFAQPHEGCYRLVRHLERQDIRKGISAPSARDAVRLVASAA